jgi:hypothetical protein
MGRQKFIKCLSFLALSLEWLYQSVLYGKPALIGVEDHLDSDAHTFDLFGPTDYPSVTAEVLCNLPAQVGVARQFHANESYRSTRTAVSYSSWRITPVAVWDWRHEWRDHPTAAGNGGRQGWSLVPGAERQ